MFHRNKFKLLLLVTNSFHKHILAKTQNFSLSNIASGALSAGSSYTDIDPLSFCFIVQTIRQTKQVHGFGLVNGFLPHSVSLCASLMLKYATFGDPETSGFLFNQTVGYCQNAFLWNTLIRAYYIAGYDDGFQTYNEMVSVGVHPDDHTFPFVLKACSDYLELSKGVEIHGAVFKLGFDKDVFVANTLMLFYGNCGGLCEARMVFDEMLERDNVSWNTILGLFSLNGCNMEAVTCFKGSLDHGFRPDLVSIVSFLPVCADLEDRVMVSSVHSYIVKVGLADQLRANNGLVDAYGKCGNLVASKQVFEEMDEKTEVSWNSVITSLAYKSHNRDVLNVFRLMIDAGVTPNSITISSLLPVLGELEFFGLGREVHGFCMRMGINSDVFIANSLVDIYAKTGNSELASNVFDNMVERNVVSWNAMIANFSQNGLERAAMGLLKEMQAYGELPNTITITNVLPACSRLGFLHAGKAIHARTIHMGASSDIFVSNALTDMYSKCGCLNLAQNLFDTSLKDEVSYNILIVGYSQTSHCSMSLNFFSEMRSSGMVPDSVSFVGVISACANLAASKQGKEIHGLLLKAHLHTHLFASNALLDFYTKCARIDLANNVFVNIQSKNVTSWNIMILGYGMLGEHEMAISFFDSMKEDGLEPDSVSYIAVLTACSHGGLLEKGSEYFEEMLHLHIKPTHMHYACLIDLLGRAGLMEEAVDVIRNLPFYPDSNIWGALLGACRIHCNVELGCWSAEHLFMLKPKNCGYYVLLSNLYAEAGRWDEANRIRELMKLRGARKHPGCTWVQIGDQVHAFLVVEKAEGVEVDFLLEEFC